MTVLQPAIWAGYISIEHSIHLLTILKHPRYQLRTGRSRQGWLKYHCYLN